MAKIEGTLRYSEHWKPASELHALREEPQFAQLQVPGLKSILAPGLERGIIAEIHGPRSSGKTAVCLHILAQATARGEICAVVDLYDSADPISAADVGVKLERIVWVRCQGNAEHAMRASDLLLHAGGFGVIVLNLCEAEARILNRIPLSYWYRFRRAVEHTATVLLVCADAPQAKASAASSLHLKPKKFCWSGKASFQLLRGLETYATLGKVAAIRPQPLFLPTVV